MNFADTEVHHNPANRETEELLEAKEEEVLKLTAQLETLEQEKQRWERLCKEMQAKITKMIANGNEDEDSEEQDEDGEDSDVSEEEAQMTKKQTKKMTKAGQEKSKKNNNNKQQPTKVNKKKLREERTTSNTPNKKIKK